MNNENIVKSKTHNIPESKTDDELSSKKKIISKKKTKTQRKTTTDVSDVVLKHEKEKEEKEEKERNGQVGEEKKVVKKKIIKKKVIKKKKDDVCTDIITKNEEKVKNEKLETVQEHTKYNISPENTLTTQNTSNLRSTTEVIEENISEKRDKYELPKIKKRKIRNNEYRNNKRYIKSNIKCTR